LLAFQERFPDSADLTPALGVWGLNCAELNIHIGPGYATPLQHLGTSVEPEQ